jgi:hypothetical protein
METPETVAPVFERFAVASKPNRHPEDGFL